MNQAPQHRVRTNATKPRSLGIAYLLFVLTAFIGIHWFYLGRPGLAVAKFLTLNFFFVGMVIDAAMMPKNVRQANGYA